MNNSLKIFNKHLSEWFISKFNNPTEIQTLAWPEIADGKHVLVTAPTGCGKTLTAFLWAINQLITETWDRHGTRVLYISPLKALNNDIKRNLEDPLKELSDYFSRKGKTFPDISVMTRSGDTPQSDRRKMFKSPPDILITTPESLNILLTSKNGRSLLTGLKTVILDEIHSVVSSKRGTHLITAIDRLIPLSGEFQRIALSATVRPLETIASFVGGFKLEMNNGKVLYSPRDVKIIQSNSLKEYRISVRLPEEAAKRDFEKETLWESLTSVFKEKIRQNRSTLFFVNNRRLTEKLALQINLGEKEPVAYAHHGSLSREIRDEVERRFKEGDLKAVFATNSLEMGIDIGSIDEVVLIQSPPSVSSAVQRIGRSGHRVGEVSRGTFYPSHARDFLETAVLVSCIDQKEIENTWPVLNPLDVLGQIIISESAGDWVSEKYLFDLLRSSYPYRNLSEKQYLLVLEMLAGKYSQARIRELSPKLSRDRIAGTLRATKGARLDLFMSGGTIPDVGYYKLRHHETGALIGELDEEFVWEAKPGQNFYLGAQNWKIRKITHNDVLVESAETFLKDTPFWKAEARNRDFYLSEKISLFLKWADDKLEHPDFKQTLETGHHMDERSAIKLVSFLKKQKKSTGLPLPHRHHVIFEYVKTGPGMSPGKQVLMHNFWGGKVNKPFAIALEAAWEEKTGGRVEIDADNDSIALILSEDITASEILDLVNNRNLENLIRKKLEFSGFFAARFRECAARSLLITKKNMNMRLPLWMSRLKSQKLLEAVKGYDDFPVLLETWRSCLTDEFDLDSLKMLLDELDTGTITWSETYTAVPSPFASDTAYTQINRFMYQLDQPLSGKTSALSENLIREITLDSGLRPSIETGFVRDFQLKRQRLLPEYAPKDMHDLIEWIKERVVIPLSEWNTLFGLMDSEKSGPGENILKDSGGRILKGEFGDSGLSLIFHLENAWEVMNFLPFNGNKPSLSMIGSGEIIPVSGLKRYGEEDTAREEFLLNFLENWLRFYGPVTPGFISDTLALDEASINGYMNDLMESEKIISGTLIKNSNEIFICDAENYEILLRMRRKSAVPVFNPLPPEQLSLFLANYHGLGEYRECADSMFDSLEHLAFYELPADYWETEILPCRFDTYDPSLFARVFREESMAWIGSKDKKIRFVFDTDFDLIKIPETGGEKGLFEIFKDDTARYDVMSIVNRTGRSVSDISESLWSYAWQGLISNDSVDTLRKGIETGFRIKNTGVPDTRSRRRKRSVRRAGFSQWKHQIPASGSWYVLNYPENRDTLLEVEEKGREKARILLGRYGILFRELLLKEPEGFRWSDIFRSLRIMELAGEIISGVFFHGIPGLQFIMPGTLNLLKGEVDHKKIYWINALDPVSLCGIRNGDLKKGLPKRVGRNHVVYRGATPILISESNGKKLTFNIPEDDPDINKTLTLFDHLLKRRFQPLRQIRVEHINGLKAPESPFVELFYGKFDVDKGYDTLQLSRKLI